MEERKEVTFGEWFLTLFLMAIPIVNLVLLFVWGCKTVFSMFKKGFREQYTSKTMKNITKGTRDEGIHL